jgi:hypothetical protein
MQSRAGSIAACKTMIEDIGVICGICLSCYRDVRIGEKSRIAQAVA